MFKKSCYILIVLCASCFPFLSLAQETPDDKKGWQMTCMSQATCELKQVLIHKERVAASVSIMSAHNYVWLHYIIPIGIDIEQGVTFSVDAGVVKKTTISNCTILGCAGHLDLTADFLAEMKKGQVLKINFVSPKLHELFIIQFSLSGFTDAFQTLINYPSAN